MRKIISYLLVIIMLLTSIFIYKPYDVKAKMRMNNKKITLKVGKRKQLRVKDKYNYYGASWWSSNPAIATVNSNGKVKAKQPGKVTIYARTNNRTFKCKVRVKIKIVKHSYLNDQYGSTRVKVKKINYTTRFDDEYCAVVKFKCLRANNDDDDFSTNVYYYKGSRIVESDFIHIFHLKKGRTYYEEINYIPSGTTKIVFMKN